MFIYLSNYIYYLPLRLQFIYY